MNRLRLAVALPLFAVSALFAGIDPSVATPPVAKKVPHKAELHGEVRVDDYYWLRDKEDPEVIKYLEAENAYTAKVMKPTEPIQKRLYDEMLGRIKQTDQSVPYKYGGYWYYTRTVEGKQYSIRCRKKGSPTAPEEVILDENELARGEKFFSVGATRVSDDGNLLAFTTDTTGFREYELSVKNLRTGKLVEKRLVKAPTVEWAADNKTLFYVTEDEVKRPHKLWRHTLGQPKEKDELLFEEKDELFWLEVSRSRSRKYLFRRSESYGSDEQWYLPADQPTGEWKVILPREDKHEYNADHRDGKFHIRTNKGATNFKVVTCPVGKTDPANWTDLVPHDPKVLVEDMAVFMRHVVVSEREAANPQVRVIDPASGKSYRVGWDEPIYDVGLGANPEFDTPSVRLRYSSPLTPDSVYEFDMTTRARKLLKRDEVLGGYDPNLYATERVYATAPDGTSVPISLVHKKGLNRDGTAGCLLYGYGSYGSTIPMDFDSTVFSLLDRGVVYAHAHIRGGADLGRQWYDDGKMLKKKNTFTDFIACADFLVKEGVCSRDRLVIQGGSAGGLLIGAVVTMRPDVCKAAVLQVPFVDVINTMADETIPLTVQEFQQWGNPAKQDDYAYMKSYCPYTNIKKTAYPAMLVMTSLNDSQVLFHEPAKFVAKLRALKTDKNPLLLKCNMDAGHGGASGRYDNLKEKAFLTAFVLDQMGITK